jgi:hypothetical protein
MYYCLLAMTIVLGARLASVSVMPERALSVDDFSEIICKRLRQGSIGSL